MSRICVFPGTFDPVTNGHLNIIERASRLFDKVFVVILDNPKKDAMFSKDKRLEMLKAVASRFKNVEADCSGGLLVEYASSVNADVIVRGIRNQSDFLYESDMYKINSRLNEKIDTVFLPVAEGLEYVSSSAVRELLSFGKDASEFVPIEVSDMIKDQL